MVSAFYFCLKELLYSHYESLWSLQIIKFVNKTLVFFIPPEEDWLILITDLRSSIGKLLKILLIFNNVFK